MNRLKLALLALCLCQPAFADETASCPEKREACKARCEAIEPDRSKPLELQQKIREKLECTNKCVEEFACTGEE